MATKLSLKEGVNWVDPQKAAKKRASLARAGKARGGKPMGAKERAGAERRGGKAMGDGKAAFAPVSIDKSTTVAVKPTKTTSKAAPTMTKGSMKRSAIPKAEMTVRDVVTENKMSAPASSGISKKARTIQIGGLVGRTGGKWHLGKKVGKG